MLACTPQGVKQGPGSDATERDGSGWTVRRIQVADVHIVDGIIRILELDIQDPKAAAALAEYPETRWAEITRRAVKIGLGYLRGGGRD